MYNSNAVVPAACPELYGAIPASRFRPTAANADTIAITLCIAV